MLKVNEEKILEDYKILTDKKAVGIAKLENETKALAVSRGYSEEKIEQFVEYVKGFGDNGLTDTENAKLAFIEEYLLEVPEDIYENTESVAETVEVHEISDINTIV